MDTDAPTPASAPAAPSAGAVTPAECYRRMYLIRRFEETLLRLFEEGRLSGTTHCCIGQEGGCVGVVSQLRPGDHIFSNHRGHGHFLAWTDNPAGLLAEIMGKAAGVCGGLGGSQHLCAPGFKSNGILGGTAPAAAGIALAEKLRGGDGVSVVFLGDGALGEGVVYETLNLASLWRLPLLVVVEDNEWAQSTPRRLALAGSFAGRFDAFGIPCTELPGDDVVAVAAAAGRVLGEIRRERRPGALVLHTYRFCHHSKNDDHRAPAEVEANRHRDPLRVHGARLPAAVRAAIEAEVDARLARVVAETEALS